MTMNYRTIPPMPGIPVDVGAAWQVVPSSSGVTLDENRALLVVGREVKDGSLFTVSAQIAQRGKVRNNSLYVYTRQANPFAGNWREDGGNIGELYVYPDRRFSVTVHPFELYRDYWGHISYDLKNRRISFTIEGGNRIPADFDLEGAFRIRKDGALELNGIYFGTMDRTDSFKQRCLFRKAGK
ncbi:MAG: hypothetical protein HGA70_10020 [Chlorobiaceae bacterium]|nr:hypothetical protein [Chlorobiaceae bacterium]